MNSKVIAVDLAKDVFEVAIANSQYRIVERHRLDRKAFRRFLLTHEFADVLIEACGSAHHWGRVATRAGHTVRMLPARYVAPYRQRGKSDRIDVEAILEADRCASIVPVPIRSEEQQQIQQLHRIREQWKKTRTQRINSLRGFLAELGHVIPQGANVVARRVHVILDQHEIPPALRELYLHLLDEIDAAARSIAQADRQLSALTRSNHAVQRLREVPGVGPLTSTALVASVGSPQRFASGRKLACWVGLTPKQHSSGNRHRLGRITKQGDTYLRMLLVHGARSVLARARQLERRGETLSPLQRWALTLEHRVGHNKATCALANKLVRICWAVWTTDTPYNSRTALAR